MSFDYRYSLIPAGAITDARVTARALQVLCLLGRHVNNAGWCTRSQVRMAKELKCGRSTIYDALDLLIDTGWIERRANGRGSRAPEEGEHPFASYSYRVVLDREVLLPGTIDAGDETASGGAAQAAGGAGIAAGGAAPEPAPLEGTPSEGIPSEPERENARARDHEKFAKWLSKFMTAWPTAAADDVTRLANVARALTDGERDEALAKIPAFLAHLDKLKRKHIPAGWTYLEQKRWLLLAEEKPAEPSAFCAEEGGLQWRIWETVFRIARRDGPPHFVVSGPRGQRKMSVRQALPEALIALADEARPWALVEDGSQQFAAWMRWLQNLMPSNFIMFQMQRGKRALLVPARDDGSLWPPRKDGSLGPPGVDQTGT